MQSLITTVKKYTILIIDDSAEDRKVYRRFLSKGLTVSYQIVETESGEEEFRTARFNSARSDFARLSPARL